MNGLLQIPVDKSGIGQRSTPTLNFYEMCLKSPVQCGAAMFHILHYFCGKSKITLFSKGPYPSYDPGTMKFSKESPTNPADNLITRHIDIAEDRADDLEFLRGLYPDLNDDKLLEVKERLDGYFEVVLQVFLEKYPKGSIDDSLKSS